MKHTPGPWQANKQWSDLEHHRVIYVRKGPEIIAQCWRTGCDRGLALEDRERETVDNANLIASAPEMAKEFLSLSNLDPDLIRDEGRMYQVLCDIRNAAKVLSAKAEGREP